MIKPGQAPRGDLPVRLAERIEEPETRGREREAGRWTWFGREALGGMGSDWVGLIGPGPKLDG
ncbi:hypothetical protein THARTR1_01951 [Trichoderma harzianum]|uniref:Uncharacterized protein n=1 Tax=Trichoderma harzianum TaxID=5544 RepID=A0A2K0UJ24_TRIHA|nr:hypothetical protein THARTR1_01951 [Trichoderma harzianum]